jgi:hypothetical protein
MPRPMRSVDFFLTPELLSKRLWRTSIHHETHQHTVKIMHSEKRDIVLHRLQEIKSMIEDIEKYHLQVYIVI